VNVAEMAETKQTPRSAHQCFDALYRSHHREILAYCLRRLPPSDAEDAAAEVFAVAWRRIDKVPDGERAIAWLYGAAHRVLANQWRSRRRRHRLMRRLVGLATVPSITPEAQVVMRQEHEMLLTALDRLRWCDQDILRLAVWEKIPYRAIGEALGVGEAAVGQRVARARRRLAAELRSVERSHRTTDPSKSPEGGMT
jgi:RNA polymerase sigma-70 factor (ECF subfamily)